MRYSNLDLVAQYLEALQSEMDVSESGDVSKSMTVKSAIHRISWRLLDMEEYPGDFPEQEVSSDELSQIIDEFAFPYDLVSDPSFAIKDINHSNACFFRRRQIRMSGGPSTWYSLLPSHTHYFATENNWIN